MLMNTQNKPICSNYKMVTIVNIRSKHTKKQSNQQINSAQVMQLFSHVGVYPSPQTSLFDSALNLIELFPALSTPSMH